MIAKLKGKIDDLKPTEMVLDVGGVGYGIQIPVSTYEKIVGLNDITLHIHTVHKEDQFRLFGFYTEKEKELFRTLIDISGIGPSIALSVLSGITADMLIESVKSDNISMLVKIPGIGKAKAEKLLFELKRKVKKVEHLASGDAVSSSRGDALEALVSLGFDDSKAGGAVDAVLKTVPDASIEIIIKEALKFLSR